MKILSLEHVGCLQNVSKQIDLGQNVFIYGLLWAKWSREVNFKRFV